MSGLWAFKENSVQIFLLAIWSSDVLKKQLEKFFPKRLWKKEIKKPGFKSNPGLTLIGLWTTGPKGLSDNINKMSYTKVVQFLIEERFYIL